MKLPIIYSFIALTLVLSAGLYLRYKPFDRISQKVLITDGSYSTSITEFSEEDVALHATDTDCWASLSGNVYNITQFIAELSQDQVITQICGRDATAVFNLAKSRLPGNTQALIESYYIGTLKK